MDITEKVNELRARLLESVDGEVTWASPEDLSRRAFEALMGDSIGRVLRSRGILHLTGDGVTGTSAPVAAVAEVMGTFQKLADATGAALRGHQGLRGRLPADVTSRTALMLNASPIPGSVILEVSPATPPESELSPTGEVSMLGDEEEPLADQAVTQGLNVLEHGRTASADADDFATLLEESGPRVASAVQTLVTTLSTWHFDITLSWEQPGKPTRRTRLSESDSRFISQLITSRELDAEPVALEGTIHTLSDVKNLMLGTSEGMITIARGDLGSADQAGISIGDSVRIHTEMRITRGPGGTETAKYKALRIERLGP